MSNSSSSQSPPPESTPLSPAGTASGKDSTPSPASPSSNNSPPSPSSNSSPPSQNSGSPTPPSQSVSPPSPPTPSPPSSDSSNPSPVSDSSPPSPSPSPPSSSEGSTPPPSSNGSRPPASNSSPPPAENDTRVTSPPISPPPPKSQLPSPTTDLFPPPPPPLSPSSDDFSPPVKPKHYRGPPPPSSDDQTPSTNSNSSTPTPDSSGRNNGAIAGLVVAGVIVVLVSVLFVVIRKRRRRWDDLDYRPPTIISVRTDGYRQANPMGGTGYSGPYYSSGPQSGGFGGMEGSTEYGNHSGPFSAPGSQSSFTYEELAEVTNGFSRENIIGEGGFGCVYKGCLPDGRKVAVKQLKAGSGQGEREFRAEVEIISRVHHRHLVSLVGYCIAEYHRLLVYEFLPNDTLEHHLHAKNLPVMDWSKRVRIAIGSAKGLAYLHEDCHPRIIHRDIKSANILLEDSFEPQVADFGLAKLSNDAHTHVSTRVMGTFGYMAPEYASSGKLTDRSDVFSFGVVLLELITGRKPVDTTRPLGDESLVEWARPLLVHALETGNCDELVDPRLDNNYNKTEMLRMIEAAAACVRHSAPKRPRMVQVARSLDIEDSMPDLTNGVKYGQSQAFDSRQYSSDIQKFRLMAFGNNETNTFGDPSGEYDRQSAPYSGEFHGNQQRPQPPKDQQSSGEYSGTHDSDTNPMFRGERSNVVGSFRQSGRGFT